MIEAFFMFYSTLAEFARSLEPGECASLELFRFDFALILSDFLFILKICFNKYAKMNKTSATDGMSTKEKKLFQEMLVSFSTKRLELISNLRLVFLRRKEIQNRHQEL
jgi:hypothetical protein